jgi:hypothetical protein
LRVQNDVCLQQLAYYIHRNPHPPQADSNGPEVAIPT